MAVALLDSIGAGIRSRGSDFAPLSPDFAVGKRHDGFDFAQNTRRRAEPPALDDLAVSYRLDQRQKFVG